MPNEHLTEIIWHPDASAGLRRLLPVYAAIALIHARATPLLTTMVGGPRPVVVFKGNHSPTIVLDTVAPSLELERLTEAQVIENVRPLFSATLITAYAALKEKAKITAHDPRPTIQFFRHIRNGVSHGDMLSFRNGEPKYPAHWRGLTLRAGMAGTVVLYKLLNAGDVLHLINDAFTEALPIRGYPPTVGADATFEAKPLPGDGS